jgi:HD superfamily phosphohydrolase
VEKLLRTLPPLLGHVQADLEEFFDAPLKDYLDRLRERPRPSSPKIINDPLWHTVRVNPWEIALLDSPIVQRLRNVKQLGLASYVYPGAGYSRFEHTLGVVHQTQRFIESINRNARSQGVDHLDPIQQEDEIVLRLAALLHDVGHGFLSHVSERAMMRLPVGDGGDTARKAIRAAKNHWVCKGNPALAEVLAALIVTSSKVAELFDVADVPRWRHNSHGLTEQIARLIVGGNAFPNRPFLGEIISGAVDGDKLDYMSRDCYMAGLPMPVDVDRLLEKVHVVSIAAAKKYADYAGIAPGDVIQNLAIHSAGGRTVEELVISRVLLYEKLYHHQKVRALEGMVENAVELLATREPVFTKLSSYLAISDAEFLEAHWGKLEHPHSPEVTKARGIVDDIRRRRTLIRAFVFGNALITGIEDPGVRRDRWNELTPLVSGQRSQQSEDVKALVVERARQYLTAAGLAKSAKTLTADFVVIDLPAMQGIAAKTTFWISQRDELVLYSDQARIERWAEAYEDQKTIGYVFGLAEHAEALHLAFRDVVKDKTSLEFDSRCFQLTKLGLARTNQLADAVSKQSTFKTNPVVVAATAKTSVVPATSSTVLHALYGSRLRELAARFQTYSAGSGTPIDVERLTQWLLQFDRAEAPFAMRILENIQFWDRRALVDAFINGTEMLPSSARAGTFIPFGGADKSSRIISYFLPDGSAETEKLRIVASVNDLKEPGSVVFFDDISASGKQGSTGLRQLFGEAPAVDDVDEEVVPAANPSALEVLSKSDITFLYITGRRTGAARVVDTMKSLVKHDRVTAHVVSPAEIGCFQAGARVFTERVEAVAAEAVFRSKGRRALHDKLDGKKWTESTIDAAALGYGGLAGLTVFSYNTPAATLTALWKDCVAEGHRWHALFHRRTAATVPRQDKLALEHPTE